MPVAMVYDVYIVVLYPNNSSGKRFCICARTITNRVHTCNGEELQHRKALEKARMVLASAIEILASDLLLVDSGRVRSADAEHIARVLEPLDDAAVQFVLG